MRPPAFMAGWLLLGALFGFQDYTAVRLMGYTIPFRRIMFADELHFLIWGVITQLVWWKLQLFIQEGKLSSVIGRLLPLSLLASVLEEAIWSAFFPHGLLNHAHQTWWKTFSFYEQNEFINNLVIFWLAVGLLRAFGYYQRLREKENADNLIMAELTNAQLRALRMQLNPHFLFNTLNSISSLMRADVDSADVMLERMSSMLRMSLDRGDARLISLSEEVEFVQLYLSIQRMRFPRTVHHYVAIEPEVLDALVPTMILQPLVENAYIHGVARTVGEGYVGIEAQSHEGKLRLCVRNSGRGLGRGQNRGKGVGIANVRSRLELHYGNQQSFTLEERSEGEVQAILLLPLEISSGSRPGAVSQSYAD
ncbi:MAG TPA: histidine kinase [Acidobacteriaceae bacterium]|nr:histidine kinase [Acidobacteriaceae bacterium]